MENNDYSGLDALSIVTNMNTITSNLSYSMGYTDEHETTQKRKQSKVTDNKQETSPSPSSKEGVSDSNISAPSTMQVALALQKILGQGTEGVSLNEAINQDKSVSKTESTFEPKLSHASGALQKILGGNNG